MFVSLSIFSQPNFTYNDLPNIGDNDSLSHNPTYTHSGDLDTETGNNYSWDFSNLILGNVFWAVDSFRVKTHPASAAFTNASIEYFHQEASGNNLELYSYSGDTLYIHRTGPVTGGGAAFNPALASIHFPIAFNGASNITEPIYFGTIQTGERQTNTLYDGFGNLMLPNGQSFNNIFRIKSVVTDSTFSTGFTVQYTSYIWYAQGGDIPLLRISKTDFNGSNGTIYNIYIRKNTQTVSVNDVNKESRILVYPNPSSDILDIKGYDHNSSYTIFEANGKTVKYGILQDSQTQINIESLPVGIYFLELSDERSALRFVKK
jgi:hypothetical protein